MKNKQDAPRLGVRDFFSGRNVFTTKHLTVMAVLLAARTLLGLPFLTIYVANIKLITFAYLTDAICAMLYGPWAALAFGFAGDTLGFFASLSSGGSYFPGYAISEMVTGFIFALFLYRRNITWARVMLAWILNMILVILGLNMLWLITTMGLKAGEVLTGLRIGLNLVQAPIHIALVYFLLTKIRKNERFTAI